MNWKRWIAIGILAAWLAFLSTAPGAWAQEYRFTLDRNISHVIVNKDGSASIEYWLTFTCDSGAHPIDIVDVGMPNKTYDVGSARAWYSAGTGSGPESPLADIRQNEYIDVAIEVHMGKHTIQPGQQGTLHVKILVKQMVYPDSKDDEYASVEFSPLWYQSQNVHGSAHTEIHFYFPPGVTNEETRYHDQEFDEVDLVDDRIVFIYLHPDAKGSTTYKHGISFPRTYVDEVHKAPVVIGGGGSGGGSSTSGLLGSLPIFGCFAFFFGGMIVLGVVRSNKRKMAYLPPALSVEGVGIKRGLTAVEAALLLETPLNKVLTMILFGLLKKRAVTVTGDDPLRLKVASPPPDVKLRPYEKSFLASIKKDGSLDEKALQKAFVTLVRSVNKRLKGFSRKETVAFYRSIVDRAWDQVTSETAPEVKSKYFDQGLEWMMMDDKFGERTTETFSGIPVFMPPWWAHYRPWVPRVRSARSGSSTAASGGTSSGSGGGRQVTLPTLPGSAFAGTVVSGIEATAGGIVSKVDSFTSGVTQRTNPPPKSSGSSSGRSFKSGGCACACACACAGCACACAGGGR